MTQGRLGKINRQIRLACVLRARFSQGRLTKAVNAGQQ